MTRTLVAGIGNIFFGDDAFGCAVVRELAGRELPAGVTVRDFGIRTLDLAYALLDDFDEVILVDTVSRGRAPGTLCLLALDGDHTTEPPEPSGAHGLAPEEILSRARLLGANWRCVRLLGCEPEGFGDELSAPVRAAVLEAARWIEELVSEERDERAGGVV
jgi:hydrogenase maturation protease